MTTQLHTHKGGCHCGAVRFSIEVPEPFDVEICNCTICAMSGNDHVIVPSSRFTLLQGKEALTQYSFNTHAAKHLFCSICGVKSFYIPRSNPDGYAVTWRCLDDWAQLSPNQANFDGQNWEANAASLAHKSKDP